MTSWHVIALSSALLLASGCAQRFGELERLRQFVVLEQFGECDGMYPCPSSPPDQLREYVESHYESSVDVRALAAMYFLEFDRRMLDAGQISVGSRKGDLVDVLWKHEASRNWRIRESCGASDMRAHIGANIGWFGGGDELKRKLAENDRSHAALMAEYSAPD